MNTTDCFSIVGYKPNDTIWTLDKNIARFNSGKLFNFINASALFELKAG